MPHVASGLTLRHYTSFSVCPTQHALKERIASETPEFGRFGIHAMASVFDNGDILWGDSHEYDEEISPFDKAEIDELLLRERCKVIRIGRYMNPKRCPALVYSSVLAALE